MDHAASLSRFSIWEQGAALRKIKKKMVHQELISEVLMTLRFPAEAADIKRRIESLIEREWLAGRIHCWKCLRSVAVISEKKDEKGDMKHPTELAWTGFTLYLFTITFFFIDSCRPCFLVRIPSAQGAWSGIPQTNREWPATPTWHEIVGPVVTASSSNKSWGWPNGVLSQNGLKWLQFESTKAVPSAVGYAKPQFRKDCQKTGLNGLVHGKPMENCRSLMFFLHTFPIKIGGEKLPAEAMGDSQVIGAKSSGLHWSNWRRWMLLAGTSWDISNYHICVHIIICMYVCNVM